MSDPREMQLMVALMRQQQAMPKYPVGQEPKYPTLDEDLEQALKTELIKSGDRRAAKKGRPNG